LRSVASSAVIDSGPNHELLVLDGPVFVMRLKRRPTGQDVRAALVAIERDPGHASRHAIVWVVTPEVEGYDRSLLEIYRTDGKKPVMPSFMGVVVDNPMHRMVVRAVAVGFKLAMGIGFELFDDEASAVRLARVALARPPGVA
jgi:hypothetical protein